MVAQSQVGTCLPIHWMERETRKECLEVSADAPSGSSAGNLAPFCLLCSWLWLVGLMEQLSPSFSLECSWFPGRLDSDTLLSPSFPAKRKRDLNTKAMTRISGGKPMLFQSLHSACNTRSFLSDASSSPVSRTAPFPGWPYFQEWLF